MTDPETQPEVDTDLAKLADLAKAEDEAGVVDQQAASVPKPAAPHDRSAT